MELFERIRIDHREEGLSVRALARRHRVHRRAVRQALASARPPSRAVPSRAAPVMGVWRPVIRAWLVADRAAPRKQRHTARRIWERLIEEHGARVAESTVRQAVRELRAGIGSGVADVMIVGRHEPGAEAEVDFGEATVIVAGEPMVVHLFHLRLSASGRSVTLAFLGEDQQALLEGHALAFGLLGGVPGRFRRRHLVPVPAVASMADLDDLLAAADRRDGRRHVDGRRETVGQAFEAERPHLRPLPEGPFDTALALRSKVDRRARVCVRGRWYSVPASLAGRHVMVRLGARAVEASHEGRVVARHERSPIKGSQTLLLDHYLEVLARKPGAMPSSLTLAQAREGGAFTSAHERFWRRARRRLGDGPGTRALIEVLLLHRSLPFVAVHAALDTVERMGSCDPALVAIEARRIADGREMAAVTTDRSGAGRGWSRPVPALAGYDALLDAGAVR